MRSSSSAQSDVISPTRTPTRTHPRTRTQRSGTPTRHVEGFALAGEAALRAYRFERRDLNARIGRLNCKRNFAYPALLRHARFSTLPIKFDFQYFRRSGLRKEPHAILCVGHPLNASSIGRQQTWLLDRSQNSIDMFGCNRRRSRVCPPGNRRSRRRSSRALSGSKNWALSFFQAASSC